MAMAPGSPVSAGVPPIDVSGSSLVFSYSGDLTDSDLPYIYEDVFTGVDARLSIVSNTGIVPISIDDDDDYDSSIYLDLDEGNGKLTLKLEFFAADSLSPVTLSNICVNVVDIDWEQYVEFQGASTYSLTDDTNLTASIQGSVLRVSEESGNGSDYEDTQNWVEVTYDAASSITFSVGLRDGDSGSFVVTFECADWGSSTVNEFPATGSIGQIPIPDLSYLLPGTEVPAKELPHTL